MSGFTFSLKNRQTERSSRNLSGRSSVCAFPMLTDWAERWHMDVKRALHVRRLWRTCGWQLEANSSLPCSHAERYVCGRHGPYHHGQESVSVPVRYLSYCTTRYLSMPWSDPSLWHHESQYFQIHRSPILTSSFQAFVFQFNLPPWKSIFLNTSDMSYPNQ